MNLKMREKTSKILAVFVFFILLAPQGIMAQKNYDANETFKKLLAAMQYIRMYYVDSIDEPELVENAIIETLKELDPHSTYISREDLQKANEPIEGSFEGIGVTFQIYKDTILVIAPVPGGPSDKLGIMAGDKIVKIEGKDATGEDITNQYVMDRLRGKKGTEVDVTIYRPSRKKLLDYTIVRDKIPLNSVDASFMAAPGIGYIKLNRFSKSTGDEIRESILDLKEKGMEKLIFDLRGNPGGLMYPAVEISDHFLEDNRLIVYTQGLRSYPREFFATEEGLFEQGDMVVMINEGSASASEIVSGAVQDWDRGIILGRRSFGKGLVQQPFRLPDSSFMRLTTAKYYTPTGRCIQRPYDEGKEEYYMELIKRLEHGELVHADSISFPDSLKYYTPNNRTVYGGGGIMPDIFTPWDSTRVTDYFSDLVRKGAFNEFILNYLDKNRSSILRKYPEFADFKEDFRITDKILKNFTDFGSERDVEYNEEEFGDSEELIRYRLKAMMARNLWDVSSFFEIIVGIDEEYQKALQILQDEETYNKIIGMKEKP
ncbi:MAG: S41 family peptidase [Bacteroidales bacterium]|nr:S41 family peptidase [Bacteroidales bacterium]